ncbi:hypothetical protein [Propionibacterium australiense]|uniref:P-loop containing nucleoside triphosphate hydrolase n=1 Tax=Propionibacterium australiense TaxID=119981 RepID=A0A8B3FQR3_9ACTN|nr:hypothetical protein [Propionibacterium australiense]RLP08569.1 hypothetical protein D7U36_08985 [Propionibacterium australiense]
MTLVLLCSATGSPGVTTSALALALGWPRSVLLVDCDRDPAQAVQAGWLHAAPLASRGLVDLAQAHRELQPVAPLLWGRTVDLLDAGRGGPDEQAPGPGPVRRFLPGFTHPGSAVVFEPVWAELAEALAALSGSGVDVIVDAGRIGRTGLPRPLLAAAGAVLVVVRSSLRSLAAARLHLDGLRETILDTAAGAEPGFLVVGPGMPYSNAEIAHQLGLAVVADIGWRPDQAAVLSDGLPAPRRFEQRGLMRSARAAASALASATGPARAPLPVAAGDATARSSDERA